MYSISLYYKLPPKTMQGIRHYIAHFNIFLTGKRHINVTELRRFTQSNEFPFGLASQMKALVTLKISLWGTSTGLTLIFILESDLYVRISHN